MLVTCLDQKVNVVVLDGEVANAKVLSACCGERSFANRPINASPAQIAHRPDRPKRDVNRMPRIQKRALLVRRSSARALRRPARTPALATPLREQRKLPLSIALLPSTHTRYLIIEFESVN